MMYIGIMGQAVTAYNQYVDEVQDHKWEVGMKAPRDILGLDTKVEHIEVDGPEWEFLMHSFDNLPHLKNGASVIYKGDMAQFIYDNMPCSKAWNKERCNNYVNSR